MLFMVYYTIHRTSKILAIGGRSIVRGIYRSCVNCFKYNPAIPNQILDSFPIDIERYHLRLFLLVELTAVKPATRSRASL